MDVNKLAIRLIRHLRGRFSQAHLSKKLGYRHNQVFKWEAGERRIPWADFAKICELKGLKLGQSLWELFRYGGAVDSSIEILRSSISNSDLSEVAREIGVSRFRVKSWVEGKSEAFLDDVLRVIEVIEHCLDRFVISLVGVEKAEQWGMNTRIYHAEEFENRNPVFSAFLRLMETSEYKAAQNVEPGYFAARLKIISIVEEESLLQEARGLGIIQEANGKLLPSARITEMRNASYFMRQREYWMSLALEHLQTKPICPPQQIFGNLVFSASKAQKDKIVARYLSFYSDIKSIVGGDGEPEGVYLMNFQLLPLYEQ